jgi:hypothetical protein
MAPQVNDSTTSPSHGSSESTGGVLSSQVFSNPQEFLQVLKADFPKIASSENGHMPVLTKNDLIIYAQSGDDPRGRAAAHIALDHFDDLYKMSTDWAHGEKIPAISANDLDFDISLSQGKTTKEKVEDALTFGFATLVGFGSAAGLGYASVESMAESPLEGIALGTCALMGAAVGVQFTAALFQEPAHLNDLAKRDRAELASWKEINTSK